MSKEAIYENGIKKFLNDVERREKSIERSMEYAWENINSKDANLAILDWNTRELHEYEILLNECKLIKGQLKAILDEAKGE